jgi:methylenetetrahydrofolate reductase (NADPH)
MSNLIVTPSTATTAATLGLANLPPTDTEAGRGELNNATTWDEFPNGRFGDFKSPAFGNQDPWGNAAILVLYLELLLHGKRQIG